MLAGLLLVGSVVAFFVPVAPQMLDWQPMLAPREPWRAWTAAFVHLSGQHLAANVFGTLLVGAFGVVARVPWRIVAAWLVAWPLTHAGLLVEPGLLHYGGLSGMLHAGVACAAIHLVAAGTERRQAIGVATLALLIVKVISESPWGPALRYLSNWDIAIAPLVHACGLIAGFATATVVEVLHRWHERATPASS